jgi:hypothetical protein
MLPVNARAKRRRRGNSATISERVCRVSMIELL